MTSIARRLFPRLSAPSLRILTLSISGLLLSACTTIEQTPKQANTTASASIYDDYLNRDVRDDIFYFVMPDRFNNGNTANDHGSTTLAISNGGLDLTSKWAFHGGDMQGLEQKLDYLKGMGVTAIWMTPILRNRAIQHDGFAHHGYWMVDFSQIDSHFGTNGDLASLIKAAHAKGIKIFFDIITNHTADVIKYRECHQPNGDFKKGLKRCEYKSLAQLESGDTYTPFVVEEEQNVKYPEWLNDPQYYHNQGDTTFKGENSLYGDFNGLDDLNTEHPKVLSGMIDIYKNIIKEFKPDGFRIDTVRHVQLPFWQSFGPAIMDYAKEQGIPNFHIFGEVYDPNPARLSKFTIEGKLPAVLDFGFQQAAADVFYRDQHPNVINTLIDNDDYYNDADSQADLLLNFLGNHDMGRTGHFIEQGISNASAEEKLQRSILSHAFMYLSRGIPVVYYGDEQGFTGDGNDVDAREDMFPSQVKEYNDNILLGTDASTADDNFDEQHPIYQAIQQFAELRMSHTALRRGLHINRPTEKNSKVFAFSRVDIKEQKEYLVIFNADTTSQPVTLPASAKNYSRLWGDNGHSIKQGVLSTQLSPLSFAVFKAKEKVKPAQLKTLTLAPVETAKDAEDRLKVSYILNMDALHPLPLAQVTTRYKNKEGVMTLAATDNTAPYSAYLPKSDLPKGTTKIVVEANNFNGAELQQDFTIRY